ncbi:MAG: pyrroloquinoline quinone-dependent dehydrogenase [Vicinamibacterales bacterium]
MRRGGSGGWRAAVLGEIALLALLGLAAEARAQQGTTRGEWRHFGGDAGGTKYAPLDEITAENFSSLKVAWRFRTENFGAKPEYNLEATPLMVGGVLYTTVGLSRQVAAFDAITGETRWTFRFDEDARGRRAPRLNHRGLAYWTDRRGDDRVIYITPGYQLIALDAKTGRIIPSFGTKGVVDLLDGLDQPRPKDGLMGSTSPPMIVGNIAVVGTAMPSAAPTRENPAAHVRGYDVRTGRRVWIFHTIPQPGEFGYETWLKDSAAYTGNAGVWTPMSADEDLGYVYLPVETATNDTYGGHRPGDNLFATSLVCLDARTGRRVWHFQLVHHDIWDFDTVAPPVLLDVTVNGRPIKAVAQVTKQAFTYVFDRVTGAPVWPIEERPVPQSTVPGEQSAKTQPFPTKPAAFDRQGVGPDDVIDFTPALKAEALKMLGDYTVGPLYTPPSLAGANGKKGTLHLPNSTGGANWQGGVADPETGLLYVSSHTLARVYAVTKETATAGQVPTQTPSTPAQATAPPSASPAPAPAPRRMAQARLTVRSPDGDGVSNQPLTLPVLGPQGLPLIKPPYGRITAIDLNTGEHVWMTPLGTTPEWIAKHPALTGVTLPNTGRWDHAGMLVTKTLLMAGEGSGLYAVPPGSGGPMFRAYDKRTGRIVGEVKLPANQSGMPMTYMAGGRQYVVVPVGAPGVPGEFVALTLP